MKLPNNRGTYRPPALTTFANELKEIQKQIGFKVSSRGWCYLLEGNNLITKDMFDKAEKLINECRREGYLPIDFVAQDESRAFSGVESPTMDSPEEFLLGYLKLDLNCWKAYVPDWWKDEDYYIQMVVEKIDLKTLFQPVCATFHIPIANAKGWSSMLMRALFAKRFKEAEEDGKKAVLLYCGDHDPAGLHISKFLYDNVYDLHAVTWSDSVGGYDPRDMIIDRFGLNYDFIEQNQLTWINNLITGSGKNLADPNHKDYHKPYVQDYLRDIGERKCEANALVVIPHEARRLCREAIEKYLGKDAEDRFKEKRLELKSRFDDVLESTGLREALEIGISQLELITE